MYIASEKRKTNIAEYLLYMWQIEDIIRANGLDIEHIKANIVDPYVGLTDAQRKDLCDWYESLIDMMRHENVEVRGHLQINKNTLNALVTLHQDLLRAPKFASYSSEFYRTLPYIVELRSKSGDVKSGEIETCFNALYGLLIMRLQHKDVSTQTMEAIKQITRFLALLSHYFKLDEEESLRKE